MFDEPSTERILGYHLIINYPGFPRTLPDADKYVRSRKFKGINRTIVSRDKNAAFKPPKVNERIISHTLTTEEQQVYMSMKDTIKVINERVKRLQLLKDHENARRFSSYLLAMVTYLRQSIVCPLLPIANVALDMCDFEEKSELSSILLKQIKSLKLDAWMNDPASVYSSRLRSVVSTFQDHPDERLVAFTCFRTCLDLLKQHVLTTTDRRPIFTLTSTMSTTSRAKVLNDFSKSRNGILMLTYELGAEGLNLQTSFTIMLVDLWWNAGKTQQAIARVLRFGQMSSVVNVYYFTSNTGIEKAVFDKHEDKLIMLDELKDGPIKSSVKNMRMDQIIAMIANEKNTAQLENINKLCKGVK